LGNIGRGFGRANPSPFNNSKKNFGMTYGRGPASYHRPAARTEVTPTFNDLLWRAAADPELEPTIANQVGRARVLDM
jgi:hypothetical protein